MDCELIEATDADGIAEAVCGGIRAADPPDVGPRDWRPLTLALRTPDGALVGGLYGATMWGWLLIDGLWVAEALRGQGQGRRLLLAVEAEARERGCGTRLGTFDFQARAFYERLGYTVLGALPGFPAGHTHYALWKTFDVAPEGARGGPARHLHYDQDEWFYVLDGEFLIEVGADRYTFLPGDSLLAPRTAPHVWASIGTPHGRILITFLPAGRMEAFFREVTKANAMPPQDPDLWRAHGMELVGPPLAVA